jgi:hypothetical protein
MKLTDEEQALRGGQRLPAWADVDIALVVIGEVVASEGAVLARRFVEHGHMRLDAVFMDQPAEHLGRAVSAVAHQPSRIEIEALHRPFDHALCGQNLGLPDRRCRR